MEAESPARSPADPPGLTCHRSWLGADLDAPDLLTVGGFRLAVFTRRAPDKIDPDDDGPNEDGILVLGFDDGRLLVAVADGIGGHTAGDRAAAAALEALAESCRDAVVQGRGLRAGIVDGFDLAHARVTELSGNGGTTLIALALDGEELRSYHVGDSAALVTGQRGRLRHLTTAHSPVGYAVEAGLLDEEEAIVHADRHLVSNAIGIGPMRIEIGPVLRIAARDTVAVGSDGLFDNLRIEEVVDGIRRGRLDAAARGLAARTAERMRADDPEHPSKPDDLSFVLLRRDVRGRTGRDAGGRTGTGTAGRTRDPDPEPRR
jgi:serine/threonine protein phosphatase PrpC